MHRCLHNSLHFVICHLILLQVNQLVNGVGRDHIIQRLVVVGEETAFSPVEGDGCVYGGLVGRAAVTHLVLQLQILPLLPEVEIFVRACRHELVVDIMVCR